MREILLADVFTGLDLDGRGFVHPEQLLLLGTARTKLNQSLETWPESTNQAVVDHLQLSGAGLVSLQQFVQGYGQATPREVPQFVRLLMEFEAVSRWARTQTTAQCNSTAPAARQSTVRGRGTEVQQVARKEGVMEASRKRKGEEAARQRRDEDETLARQKNDEDGTARDKTEEGEEEAAERKRICRIYKHTIKMEHETEEAARKKDEEEAAKRTEEGQEAARQRDKERGHRKERELELREPARRKRCEDFVPSAKNREEQGETRREPNEAGAVNRAEKRDAGEKLLQLVECWWRNARQARRRWRLQLVEENTPDDPRRPTHACKQEDIRRTRKQAAEAAFEQRASGRQQQAKRVHSADPPGGQLQTDEQAPGTMSKPQAVNMYRVITLREVFVMFDFDGSGSIERTELMDLGKARRRLGHRDGNWTVEKNDRFVQKLGGGQGGIVTCDSFVQYFLAEFSSAGAEEFADNVEAFRQAARSCGVRNQTNDSFRRHPHTLTADQRENLDSQTSRVQHDSHKSPEEISKLEKRLLRNKEKQERMFDVRTMMSRHIP